MSLYDFRMYLKENLTSKEREYFLQHLWHKQCLINHNELSIGQLIERRMNMNRAIIEKMKEKIKKDPVLKTYLDAGINEYGLTEEEALDCMIKAWFEMVWK